MRELPQPVRSAIIRQARDVPKKVLLDPESFGTTILVLLIDHYGTEFTQWSPETIRLQVHEDFGVVIPPINFDKLMAAVAVVTTDFFYRDVARFITLANGLAGDGISEDVFEPADVSECAWAITEAMLLDPPDEPEPFSDEIRHYLAAILREEGYVSPPDVLRIAIGADIGDQIQMAFADDPTMFNAVWDSQQSKTSSVEEMLKSNILELGEQLESLPLKNGDARGLSEKIKKAFNVPVSQGRS